MPLPRLEFALDDRPGQAVFTLEVDAARIRGARPAFGPLLYLPLTQTRDRSGPTGTHRPLMLGGSISWAQEFDGLPIPAQPLLFNRNEVTVPIADDQLTRFEVRRRGGEAILGLRMWGVAEPKETGPVAAVISGSYEVPVSIPRDRWLEVLEQCGYGKRRLIELPPAPTGRGGTWDAVASQLESAAHELASGRSGASMVETRVALERLVESAGAELGVDRGQTPFGTYVDTVAEKLESSKNGKKNGRHELIGKLIRVGFGFASDPPHRGLDSAERDDATLTLSTATALYTYFACQPLRQADQSSVGVAGA